jgi:outer membrane beta-barrel protein
MAAVLGTSLCTTALAQEGPATPAIDALEEFREGRAQPKAIENRFFLKEKRFETALHLGYVPNNPFAARYVGGLVVNYHLNERLAFGADVMYSPDLGTGDLKSLVPILIDRANQVGGNEDFQQPLDKITLAAIFGVSWAPVYGKINLIGETVLNFDLYGYAGLGMLSKTRFSAVGDPTWDGTGNARDSVILNERGNAVFPAPTIGIGQNYFLNQMIAIKLDLKASFYIDQVPQYDLEVPDNRNQLYNNFVASVGVGAFFPKMKPRLYDF